MIEQLIALIAPHYCINCQKPGTKLCVDCNNNIVYKPLQHCLECHGFLKNNICPKCRLPYRFIVSCSARDAIIEQLINDFKFSGARAAACELATLLDSRLPYFPGAVAVVPVPTARSHIRQRGYDHALLLAKELARRRTLPCRQLLTRKRTARQVGADRMTRLKQAKDLYACRTTLSETITYILVDDVVTTGATVKYAAKALKAAGAKKIAVITVAYQAGN